MKLKIILFFSIIFFLSKLFSAELEFTYTGKDEYPFFLYAWMDQYKETHDMSSPSDR